MKKVYLIHGFEGSPNGGWRPYLMSEFEKQDIFAFSLSMPDPDAPILTDWIGELHRYVERDVSDELFLVGHSLGGTLILRYLEQFDCKNIKGVVIVSAPCHANENDKVKTFLASDFDWSKMKHKVPRVAVIQGDDDPYVPMSDAEEIAKELDGNLIIIPNGKHLNGSAGFTELPEALSIVTKMLNMK